MDSSAADPQPQQQPQQQQQQLSQSTQQQQQQPHHHPSQQQQQQHQYQNKSQHQHQPQHRQSQPPPPQHHQAHHPQQHQHQTKSQQQQQHHQQQHRQSQQPQPQPQHQHQQAHHPQHQHQPAQQQTQTNPQGPMFVSHAPIHIAPEVLEASQHHHAHHHPQHQQMSHGPGGHVPTQPHPQSNQHNPVMKHHPQAAMAAPQLHQQPTHHPHHQSHNHHHNNPQQQQQQRQHHHQMHHQQQMPIPPSMPQQQWIPGPHPPSSQPSQHHHPHVHHQQPGMHHPHPQQQQQQQAPPPPQQQQQPQPLHQQQQPQQLQQQQNPQQPSQPPQHHIPQPPPTHSIMVNQQFPPNPNFAFAQMGHTFVTHPAGHMPQYDHPPSASHTADPVNINAQQPPVSINNHHPGNMPLPQIQASINTATTGASNIHPMNNGSMMDPHVQNRPPMNQSYMHHIPSHYIQNPYMMVSYPHVMGSHLYSGAPMPPNPAMLPMRVPGDLGGPRPPYDPTNQAAAPLPAQKAPIVPPMVKPPVVAPNQVAMSTSTAPITPVKPREKKVLAIVDPVTKHVFSLDELKGSPSSAQQTTTPKDPSAQGISAQDPQVKESKMSSESGVISKPASDQIPSDKIPADEKLVDKPTPPAPQQLQVQQPPPQLQVQQPPQAQPQVQPQQQPHLQQPNQQQHQHIPPPPRTQLAPVIESKVSEPTKPIAKVEKPSVQEASLKVPQVAEVEEKENSSHVESKKDNDESNLSEGMASVKISDNDKAGDVHPSAEMQDEEVIKDEKEKATPVKKQTVPNLPYAAGQYSPLNREGKKKYSIEFCKAVATEMKIALHTSSSSNYRNDFTPLFLSNQHASNYRESSSQPLTRRSSQQIINKPRKIIPTHSLQQEVELKTAEKPWKPELEAEKTKVAEVGEMDTKRLLKVFRGHLNKLTPQKYDSLIEKIAALDLDGTERLNSVIDLVFDKAVDEPGFCELYARMCKVIAAKDSDFCFLLVKKCQEEFETSDLYDGLNVEDRKLDIEQEADSAKKKLMSEELYEDMRLRRKKYLGTIKLIGEMYKFGLLLPKIIGLCMNHLIEGASNENIECLCSLIATVGAKMAQEPDEAIKASLKNTLNILQDFATSKKTNELFILESRIKFKILDTIDLSKRNWRPRMVENNPKKIEEIREEVERAKEEAMRQQHHLNHSNQSKVLLKSDDRDRMRRGIGNSFNTSKKNW